MEIRVMTPDQAEKFAQENVVLITEANALSRCIDGRYDGDDLAMIAKPGGDAGDVMLIQGASNILERPLRNETAIKIIAAAIGGMQNFRFHSDDAHSEVVGLGCGHLREAKNDPEAYGLTPDQMDALFASLPELVTQGAQEVMLTGPHREQAVIVMNSETQGLKPMVKNGDDVEQVFVIQALQHAAQLDQISKLMHEAYAEQGDVLEEPKIREALQQAFAKQLEETRRRLAKGLEVCPVTDAHGSIVLQ